MPLEQAVTLAASVAETLSGADVPIAPAAPAASYPAGLSAREAEVLRLVATSLTNAEIAERLYLSPRTVQAHLYTIYRKLDVGTRAEATRFAIEHGLA